MANILSDAPEGYRDLLENTLTATLTTVDPDGHPRSTAVWYVVDDDGQLKGSTNASLQQYKDLRRNPNCCLFIIDFSNPFRTIEIRATAELTEDLENVTVRKLAQKYGLDASKAPLRKNRFTIIYHPRQLLARRFWADAILLGQDTASGE